MYSYSKKSTKNLLTCDDNLQRLFYEVIKHRDCSVLEGHRNETKQNAAYHSGHSKVKFPHGKHNKKPSEAVDVIPYPAPDWEDKRDFIEFGNFVLGIAAAMGIKIKWGGDFKGFFDGPHFEIIKGGD